MEERLGPRAGVVASGKSTAVRRRRSSAESIRLAFARAAPGNGMPDSSGRAAMRIRTEVTAVAAGASAKPPGSLHTRPNRNAGVLRSVRFDPCRRGAGCTDPHGSPRESSRCRATHRDRRQYERRGFEQTPAARCGCRRGSDSLQRRCPICRHVAGIGRWRVRRGRAGWGGIPETDAVEAGGCVLDHRWRGRSRTSLGAGDSRVRARCSRDSVGQVCFDGRIIKHDRGPQPRWVRPRRCRRVSASRRRRCDSG